jgi:integrase
MICTVVDEMRSYGDLIEGRAVLPRIGAVMAGAVESLPWAVVDAAGREVDPVSRYLRDLALGDASSATGRSYAHDLLRWFRLLWFLDVGWEQATEAEVAALVGWLRAAPNPQRRRSDRVAQAGVVNARTGKPTLAAGYAPATIAHALTVVRQFYEYHRHFARGPLLNPVPESASRRARLAHRSPLEPVVPFRRARLRPKVDSRMPRAIPDRLWDELFAQLGCVRDRALLACFVSSGARASELLGLRLGDVDWSVGKLWVVSKGSRRREPVPVSPEALAYLATYLDEVGPPAAGQTVWRTRRGPERPLTYWALRQVMARANEALGLNWTLHDLRHTAATRMARDPSLTLVEVQTILRHAHLSTTSRYTVVSLEDLMDKLAEHYQRPRPQTRWAPGYDVGDVEAVFG